MSRLPVQGLCAGRTALLVGVFALFGCKEEGKSGSLWSCESEGELETCTAEVQSSSGGGYTFELDVADDRAAFLVGIESEAQVVFESLRSPSGSTVLDYRALSSQTELLTAAMLFLGRSSASLNWPVRAQDGPLEPGGWAVSFVTVDEEGYGEPKADVTITTRAKADSALDAGRFPVRVVLADGIGDDPALRTATEEAVDHWAALWSLYGLELDVVWEDDSIDPALPMVSDGDPALARVADGGDGLRTTLLVGESIGGASEVLGESGGIPGVPWGGAYGLVAVAWLGHAGRDGAFSDAEVRIFGETMAHETGHFAGLFHPVEIDLTYQDALDDTPDCETRARCESLLGQNNLFPYPVCGRAGCLSQDELTDDQVGVLHRFTGTR